MKGLVPIDVYASIAPADEDRRQYFCGLSADEYAAYIAGFIDGPNTFQLDVGRLALSAPTEESPYAFFSGQTNRGVMFTLVGRTYLFFAPNPVYHLMGPVIEGRITGLRYTSEDATAQWLAHAAPHQSMLEQAETDAMLCGDAPPVDAPLTIRRIELDTGAATLLHTITPPPSGLRGVASLVASHDAAAYAYSYGQELSRLFLMTVDDPS